MKLLNAYNAPYYNVVGRIDYISLPHYFLLLFFSNIPTQDFWVLLNAAIFIERLGVWGEALKFRPPGIRYTDFLQLRNSYNYLIYLFGHRQGLQRFHKHKEDGLDKNRAGAVRIYACGDRNFRLVWNISVQADVGR